MPAPLSPDLRRRILEASQAASLRTVARRFDVSLSTVHRLASSGTIEPKPHAGGPERLLSDTDRPLFEAYLAEDVSMSHADMATRFFADTGREVSRPTVQRQMSRWGLTRKKR